jgi:hypothetical protein
MSMLLFELNKLFMLHLSFLIRHGSQQKAFLSKKQKCVDVGLQKDKARCWRCELKVFEAATREIALRSSLTLIVDGLRLELTTIECQMFWQTPTLNKHLTFAKRCLAPHERCRELTSEATSLCFGWKKKKRSG